MNLSPEQAVDLAHDLIMARTAHPRRLIRPHLARLEPLEALALLGLLIDDTLPRFPPAERDEVLAAFIAALDETAP